MDQKYNWLYSKLEDLKSLPNVRFSKMRFNSFWASNTILYVLLIAFREILEFGWNFDYVMNISESDFPAKPLEEFEKALKVNPGANYIATIAKGEKNLIKDKEGLLIYNSLITSKPASGK